MNLPVLILAGSRDGERDPLARLGKVSHKALLPVLGVPMIERVLSALEQTPGLGPFWVSIENPTCLEFLGDRVKLIEAAPTPSASVAQALETIGTPCLVTTADHALLRPSWIKEFLTKSRASGADLTAGIALAAQIERDVPNTQRTYIRLSDAQFSGCNLFWLGTLRALEVVSLWERLQQNRKHPLRMAMTLGGVTLLRALTRTLSVQALEKRVEDLTTANVKLISLSDGRTAVDVDKEADFHLVEELLRHSLP